MTTKPYNGRDYLNLKVINGVTKAGIHVDRKKEANKKASRGPKMKHGQNVQENGQMMAELKYLRAQLKEKTEQLRALEAEVNEPKAFETKIMQTTTKLLQIYVNQFGVIENSEEDFAFLKDCGAIF